MSSDDDYTYDYGKEWDNHYDYKEPDYDSEEERRKVEDFYTLKLEAIGCLVLINLLLWIWICVPCIKIALQSALKVQLRILDIAKTIAQSLGMQSFSYYVKRTFVLAYFLLFPLWLPLVAFNWIYIALWMAIHKAGSDFGYYLLVKDSRKKRKEPPTYEEFMEMKRMMPFYAKRYTHKKLMNNLIHRYNPFWGNEEAKPKN